VNTKRLSEILKCISKVSIGIIGDFCLDAYWDLTDRNPELSVETGKPTVEVAHQRYSLGGAGNVANNLAALGVRNLCAFGVVGNDLFGRELLRQLENLKVAVRDNILLPSDWQTPVYAKPYRGTEEQNRIDFGRSNSLLSDSESKLVSVLAKQLPKLDALIVNQQLPKSIFTPGIIHTLNQHAGKHPKKIFLVDSRNFIPEFTSMFCKLNAIEAARIFGKTIKKNESATTSDLTEYSRKLFAQTGKPLFITRGRLGILFFDGKKAAEIAALNVKEPIDPVGAGDTVVAAIGSALAAGTTPTEACSFAMIAASIAVKKLRETGTASPDEILATSRDNSEHLG
jgi:rfaE bifunctional protein kinase chain/domain